MHHLKGHENIVTLIGAFEDRASVHLVRPEHSCNVWITSRKTCRLQYLTGGGSPNTGQAGGLP